MEIKHLLVVAELAKQKLRDRLEEILNKKTGTQIIILADENKMTDFYQNTCVPHVVKRVTEAAKNYAKLTCNELINDHE